MSKQFFLAIGLICVSAPSLQANEIITSDDLDAFDPNLSVERQIAEREAARQRAFEAVLIDDEAMEIAALQVYLDRIGISPGAINGKRSPHLDRAISLHNARFPDAKLSAFKAITEKKLAETGGDAFVEYTITKEDVKGPFIGELPDRIQDQKDFDGLHFRSVEEALAERFHMDEGFLRALNRGVNFTMTGEVIRVANPGRLLNKQVARVFASKRLGQVVAYDKNGDILAIYPASVGSQDTPSPRGKFKVRNKAAYPAYTLSPDNSFEPVDSGRRVLIAPGPNNPVGTAWIGLNKKPYGIHGTPEPSRVGLAESNGCIRLTNWDAMELAVLVNQRTEVVID